jgi:hypothetical protein
VYNIDSVDISDNVTSSIGHEFEQDDGGTDSNRPNGIFEADIDPFALDESYHNDHRTSAAGGVATIGDNSAITPISAEPKLRNRLSLDTDRRAVLALDASLESSHSSFEGGDDNAINDAFSEHHHDDIDDALHVSPRVGGVNDPNGTVHALDLDDYDDASDELNNTRVVVGLSTPVVASSRARSGSPSGNLNLDRINCKSDTLHTETSADSDDITNEVALIAHGTSGESDSALFAEDLKVQRSPSHEDDDAFDVMQWISEHTVGTAPDTINCVPNSSASTAPLPSNTDVAKAEALPSNVTWVAPIKAHHDNLQDTRLASTTRFSPDEGDIASNTGDDAMEPSDYVVKISDTDAVIEDGEAVEVEADIIYKPTAQKDGPSQDKHTGPIIVEMHSDLVTDSNHSKAHQPSYDSTGPSRNAISHALPAIRSLEALHEVLAVLRADMEKSAKRESVSRL